MSVSWEPSFELIPWIEHAGDVQISHGALVPHHGARHHAGADRGVEAAAEAGIEARIGCAKHHGGWERISIRERAAVVQIAFPFSLGGRPGGRDAGIR